jgi:hypothetical protein
VILVSGSYNNVGLQHIVDGYDQVRYRFVLDSGLSYQHFNDWKNDFYLFFDNTSGVPFKINSFTIPIQFMLRNISLNNISSGIGIFTLNDNINSFPIELTDSDVFYVLIAGMGVQYLFAHSDNHYPTVVLTRNLATSQNWTLLT